MNGGVTFFFLKKTPMFGGVMFVSSFLYLMVLICKVFSNHFSKRQFMVLVIIELNYFIRMWFVIKFKGQNWEISLVANVW